MSETTPLAKTEDTKTNEDAASTTETNYGKLAVVMSVMLAIGTGLAFLSLYLDGSKTVYESKISTVKEMDLQWLFLALVILGRTIQLLNFVPTKYKNGLKGNIRSNPFFYETVTEDGKEATTVLFKEDGAKGMYNRSNRSIHHMVENSGGFFASVGPVGFLFPKQTFGAVVLFSIGRVLHQKGYATGYGSHALGFVLSMFGTLTMEGLALIAFLKAEGIL